MKLFDTYYLYTYSYADKILILYYCCYIYVYYSSGVYYLFVFLRVPAANKASKKCVHIYVFKTRRRINWGENDVGHKIMCIE